MAGRFGGALCGSGGYTYSIAVKNVGATRIIWNGEFGQPMIIYRGSGGRIVRLILNGGPLRHPNYPSLAGTGIVVEARISPPCRNLVTDQLSITQCDVGLHYLDTPDHNHADQQKHFALLMHHVRLPYWVEGMQSAVHWLYGFDLRSGWETAFKFDQGGPLNVYGCYVGGDNSGKPLTLLQIGRSNDYGGCYEIHGLQVDGSIKNLRLVDYGKYAFRVRIDGNVGFKTQLADPFVVARDRPAQDIADIKLDVRNAGVSRSGCRQVNGLASRSEELRGILEGGLPLPRPVKHFPKGSNCLYCQIVLRPELRNISAITGVPIWQHIR